MEIIRKIIINSAFLALVLAFVLFWICAGIGVHCLSVYAAFLVFIAASVLLVVTPGAHE